MTGKTPLQLTAAADVQAGDLLMTWRSSGPMTAATALQNATYIVGSAPFTTALSAYPLKANNLSDLASASTARTNLGLGSAALLTAGTSANNAVQLDGSAKLPAVDGSQLTGLGAPAVIIQNQNTLDGLSTATWNTRTLNTIIRNIGTLASLASNQITLPAGTYYFRVRAGVGSSTGASAYTAKFATRVYNVTGSAVAVPQGEAVQIGQDSLVNGMVTSTHVSGLVTLGGSSALRIETYCVVAAGSGTGGQGGGGAGAGGTDVYLTVEIWKVA